MSVPPARPQRTLARVAVVNGFGYWSGQDVRVEFRPAPVHTGLTFVRSDLPGTPRVPAAVAFRAPAARRTTLVRGPARVEMVEHLLAALAGIGIDNCEIWVDQSEMPGCDGSSAPFVAALDAAGVVDQDAPLRRLAVNSTLRCGDEQHWIEARPSRRGGLSVEFALDYGPQTVIGRQELSVTITPDAFRNELASSRTFMLAAEAQLLLDQGLGTRVSARDLLIFNETGPINNQLRFEDECVRHKVLDVVGDLALAGCDIDAHIVAYRSGHQLNAELVSTLLRHHVIQMPAARCA